MPIPSLDFTNLRTAYDLKETSPTEVILHILDEVETRGDDGVWIHRLPAKDLVARAEMLETLDEDTRAALPLYGLPFSVKDCIDVAGLPTTSACPDFAYTASRTNLAIRRAIEAGGILMGKTNMDQFATGVVGTRTPYGVARNPFNAEYIPGGSSSGAAVSVAAGLCSFAFGSDTGGSGRVPASYNNVVGLKPTLGLLSRTDMVNASLSFDTISIYALTSPDARTVLHVCQGVDPKDCYGRAPMNAPAMPAHPLRIAVPRRADRQAFGNPEAEALFEAGLAELTATGHVLHEIDFGDFLETSRMMFEGPWLAEREVQVGAFIDAHPGSIDPIVRQVIQSAKNYSASDAFKAMYRLHSYVQTIRRTFDSADLIAVPTVGTTYTVAQVRADPIATNATNGLYMNFVSMADLTAVAVPNGFLSSGVPMGMTFVAPAFAEDFLCDVADAFHRRRVATLGATGHHHPIHKISEKSAPTQNSIVASRQLRSGR